MAQHFEEFSSTVDGTLTSNNSDSSSGIRCVCGLESDSDWEDDDNELCPPRKKAKTEVSKEEDPHEQLHRALENHDCRTIRELLRYGVKPCTTNRSTNCFFLAQRYTTRFILKKFLDIEPSGINCQDLNGFTMLMLNDHDSDTFTFLCKYDPDVNLLNDDGENILLHKIRTSYQFTPWQVSQLSALGLDVNAVNNKEETALVAAIKEGFYDASMLDALFQAGATLPTPVIDGENIITRAIQKKWLKITQKIDILKVLMRYGVNVSAKDSDGRNAMYYIILEHFMELNDVDPVETNVPWIFELEDTLIMLLQKNCEVQGLDTTCSRVLYFSLCMNRLMLESLDIISTFARYGPSVKFLKELVDRGLYSWTTQRELFNQEEEPMSPLTAYLSRVFTHGTDFPNFGEILNMCKYFISIGVDVTHRCLGKNFRLGTSQIWSKRFNTDILNITSDLIHSDALFFLVFIAARDNCEDVLKEDSKCLADFEELLRLLLRFWPYPPLCLLFIGTEYEDKNGKLRMMTFPVNTIFVNLLMKIGGALPLGSYYTYLKYILQELTIYGDDWQEVFHSFLQLYRKIPSLRDSSHAALRATVKKTGPNGLDFSEFRVLCQGQMVPLPPSIVKFLEFRD